MADNNIDPQLLADLATSIEKLNRTVGASTPMNGKKLGDDLGSWLEKSVNAGVGKMFAKATKVAEEKAAELARAAGPPEAGAAEKAASTAAAKVMRKQTEAADAAVQSINMLAAAAKQFGSELYKGADGINTYAKGVQNGVSAITNFTSKLGPWGKGISMAVDAIVAYGKAAADMSDAQYKAYKSLQEVGVASTDGAQGVYDMMQSFRLSKDELDKLSKMFGENATGLAMFKGNVVDGARAVTKTFNEIAGSGLSQEMLNMGVSMETQRESMMALTTLQARSGAIQNKSVKEQAQAVAEYIKEQDALTKLTGMTRKEQEAAQNKAMDDDAFRAKYDEEIASGDEERIKNAEKAMRISKRMEKMSPEQAAVFRSGYGANGMITEGSKGINALAGGRFAQIAGQSDQLDEEETMRQFGDATKDMLATGRTLSRVGKFKDVVGTGSAGLSDFVRQVEGQSALGTMRGLGNTQSTTPEGVIGDNAKAEMNNLEITRNLQSVVQQAVPAVTAGLTGLSTAARVTTDQVARLGKAIGENPKLTRSDTFQSANNMGYGPNAGPNARSTPGAAPGAAPTIGPDGRRVPSGVTNPTGTGPALGAGPVFGRPDTTWNDKVLLTLEEMRDEVKKLTKLGAIPGGAASGQAAVQSALSEHDHAHPHGEAGSPLKDMKVTSGFGMRTDPITGRQAGHGGVDLAGKIGDAIMAPDSGIARVVGEAQSGGYGNMVEILNEQGKVIHRLAHMSEAMVKTGDKITAGSQIGKVGSTGRSTGAHLHWEQFDPTSGKQIDPMAAMSARQGSGPGGVPGMPSGPIMANSELKGQQREFYDKLYSTLLDQATKAGVKNPEAIARLGAAQSSLETGYGKATAGGNNYFGIKGSGGNQQSTQEFDPKTGKMVTQQASFRQYGSMQESAADYIKMMQGNKRYAGVLGAGSTSEAIAAQGRSGYATDPDYARKLAMITSSATGQGINLPGGIAGPSGMPMPYAAAPGATNGLPPAQVASAPAAQAAPGPGGVDPTMMAQLVSINREQNVLLARILQTSQA